MRFQRNLCIFLLTVTVAVVLADKWLAEKPNFLKPCRLSDPNFEACFRGNFESLLVEWRDGVPGLKSVGGLDPFHVKRVVIDHNQNQPVSITAGLYNVEVTGLAGATVSDVKFDRNKFITVATMAVPYMNINSDYDVKGRVLNLALQGEGKSFIKVENLEVQLLIHLKLRDEGDLTFTDIDKFRLEILEVGGFHIRLDNLFQGQKVLEDSANAVFNDNWREFFEILRPAIKEAIQTIMNDRLSKIYSYVPASYLIEDIPSAATFNG